MRRILLVAALVLAMGGQAEASTLTATDRVQTWHSRALPSGRVVEVRLFQRGKVLREGIHEDGCSVTFSNARLLATASICNRENAVLRYAGRGRFRVDVDVMG